MDIKKQDSIILEKLEKLEQATLSIQEADKDELRDNLYKTLLEKSADNIRTSRRSIEDLSLPCRMMLEHFTYFMGDYNHSMGFKLGQLLEGRAVLIDFVVQEWGNIILNLGNLTLRWRDEDYRYLFYPDKVMLKSKNRSNPDIHLSFSFSFKYTQVHRRYGEIKDHPQVEYWHEELEG